MSKVDGDEVLITIHGVHKDAAKEVRKEIEGYGFLDVRITAPQEVEPKPKGKNQFGLDARYFHEKLSLIVRDVMSFRPEEMQRALQTLSNVALPCEHADPRAKVIGVSKDTNEVVYWDAINPGNESAYDKYIRCDEAR